MKISPVALTRSSSASFSSSDAVAAEADDGERPRRADLPPRLVEHPLLEERGEPHVLADHRLQARAPVAAQHGPQPQRAERPPERDRDLAEADHLVGRPQVLRHEAERAAEVVRPRRPEDRAAHAGEQPLVRVDDERVGAARRPRCGARDTPTPSPRTRRRRAATPRPCAPRSRPTGSTEVVDVVPTVATTAHASVVSTRSARMRYASSTGTRRSSSSSTRAALSIDECVCSLQTTTRRSGITARAAASAVSVAVDAVSSM